MKRLTTLLFLSTLAWAVCLADYDGKPEPKRGRVAPDLQAALKAGSPDARVKVVVNLNRVLGGRVVNEVLALGGTVEATYRFSDQMTVDLPLGLVGSLAEIGGVDYVAPDRVVVGVESHLQVATGASIILAADRASLDPAAGGSVVSSLQPLQNDSRAKALGLDGHGIVIGVIDSGIDFDHFDLRDGGRRRSIYRVDFTGLAAEVDPFGHGTHVAGIIAGDGSSYSEYGRDYAGVAPGASLIDLRVLDSRGQGTITRVIKAIDWAVANKNAFNIRILNLSLAAPPVDSYLDDPLCRAVQRAEEAGVIVVAAAGNFGLDPDGRRVFGGITSPGISPAAITVGAADTRGTDRRSDDFVAPWSSRGPTWAPRLDPETGEVRRDGLAKPDLVAPGARIVSLQRAGSAIIRSFPELHVATSGERQNAYMRLSGTSMSAPVVAGAAALMLQANPDLNPKQVKALLMYSAELLQGEDLFAQGAGLLNIDGAVRLAAMLAMLDLPDGLDEGDVVDEPFPDPSSLIAGERVLWSEGLIWGRGVVRGYAALDARQDAYAQGLIWGISRVAWSADVLLVEDLFSDGLVAVGEGHAWTGLAEGPTAAWDGQLMPEAFYTVDSSGLIWGYSRNFLRDTGLIWGLRWFEW